jgi:hypothetical protein
VLNAPDGFGDFIRNSTKAGPDMADFKPFEHLDFIDCSKEVTLLIEEQRRKHLCPMIPPKARQVLSASL